jgi:hypothetical protein
MEQVLQHVEKAPLIVAPLHAAPRTPAEAAEGHATVTMEFPKAVHLTVSTNHSVFYPAGIHEVPDHLADHWYLKAHQVRPYYKPVQIAAQPQARPAQQQQGQRQQQQNNGRNQRAK